MMQNSENKQNESHIFDEKDNMNNPEAKQENNILKEKNLEEDFKIENEKPEVMKAKATLDMFNKIIRVIQIIVFLAIISFIYL